MNDPSKDLIRAQRWSAIGLGAAPSIRRLLGCVLWCLCSTAAAADAAPADSKQAAVASAQATAPEIDPVAFMTEAIDLTRGLTSVAKFTMVIHRPSWERSSSLHAWTRGREDALIRFTAPAKDAGNATLKQGEKMWTYTPRLNRTIRLPFSLMSQSWAGSDFSYTDLSRSDDLLKHYELSIAAADYVDGHWQYRIVAIPHDDAPVVWGKEEVLVREDFVMLEQTFFDQDMVPLKRMQTLKVGELGGRVFGTHMRMVPLDKPEQYTELIYDAAEFDIDVPDQTFTLFALKRGG